MANMRLAVLGACLLLGPMLAKAEAVVLTGVASGRALLVVGQEAPRFVAVNQVHRGVRVLVVTSDGAEVEFQGRRQHLRVGQPVSVGGPGPSTEAGASRIVLTAGSGGHFVPLGQINGRSVVFMVDTGATLVILGAAEARRVGLDPERGEPARVSTANGEVVGRRVRLDSVRLGEVQVHGVDAMVLPQAMPYVLLGNSFLSRFQMQRTNDQMVLERRY